MKIDDVSLTLFAWDDIPATTYGRHTGHFAGKSQLGLLRMSRDAGVESRATTLRCIGAVDIALMGRKRTAVLT